MTSKINPTVIMNLDANKPREVNPNYFMPTHQFRMFMIAPSGKGKTNVLINLLINEGLVFDKLYINAMHHETDDKYKLLKEMIKALEDDPLWTVDKPIAHWAKTTAEAIPMSEFDPKKRNIVIYDDFMMQNQKDIIDFFISGRHVNASIIYLAQTYFDVPKPMRLQATHYLFFDIASEVEIKMIARDHNKGLPKEVFYDIFNMAISGDHTFFLVDKTAKDISMRYRQNWDRLLTYDVKQNETLDEELKKI